MEFLSRLFDTSDFPPRWQCGRWAPGHGWLHVLSDLGVWSAYVAIPCVLGYFVLRRKDIPFRTVFLLFGAFILACGTTHLMEAVLFWWPAYRLAGVIKLLTAVVSWCTVLALVRVAPKALAMRGPEELEREIVARKSAENALEQANAELRQQVAALRASEERFRLLVEGATDHAIFMLDPHGRVASWNSGAERIKGYRADEVLGQHISRFYPAEAVAEGKPDRALRAAAAVGKYEEEGWRLRQDGSRFWASVVLTALRDEAGNLRGFSKITRDRSERKRAEEAARRLLEEEAARRAAEEHAAAIREQREWFRTTLASIGDAVITTDTEGRVTFLNPVAEALTGWSEQTGAHGTPLETVFNILHEQTRVPVENPVTRALREGTVVGLANHTVLLARDGTERPIDDSAAPIRDARGRMVGVVLVFRDVTQRRRTELEIIELNRGLHRRVTEFQTLLDVLPVGIALAEDPECRGIWSNPALARLLGLPAHANVSLSASAPERPNFKVYDGDCELSPDELPIQVAIATGQPVSGVKHDILLADGTRRNLLQYAVPLHDEQGRVRGGLYVGVDVTEQERMQKALREAEARWRTMTEALPNLVWTDLPDGQCDWLSTQWSKYTGIPESELLGLRWLETVIHPDDRERTMQCWQAACADEGNYDLEYRIRRHDGAYHWFKTRGVPIRDNEGKIVYWFGTCTDIEDIKRLETALREADRRKNEFLATLAHELRNPLAPIRTGLQVLRLSADPAEQEQARAMMERQLGQMVRLIDDLLDISRLSRDKLELRKARVSLASVVDNAVETARPHIDARGQTLTVTLPPGPVVLDADLTRLAQVLWNLLNNSAKYTDPGGRIELSARVEGGEVVVAVRDTGIGIPAEALPRLFGLFSQVDHSLERAEGGLGIGLALVKGLVEMHGGSAEARSDGLGRGSEFLVRLPLAAGDVEETRPPAAAVPAAASRRRILIVDDNRDGAATLTLMLTLLGHETRTGHDGLEALELAEAFRPQVMLLDIGLPKLNGYDTCRRIREQPWGRDIFIVAVTGWGQEDDRRRSLEAGFDHHLVKPVAHAVLTELLADLEWMPR